MHIRILYNDRRDFPALPQSAPDASADWDVVDTVDLLEATIHGLGYTASRSRVKHGVLNWLDGHFDIAFNICELTGGAFREAVVPAILDYMDIPFVFSDASTMHVTLDKSLANNLALGAGFLIPQSFVLRTPDIPYSVDLSFPLLVKPLHEGSGMGIHFDSVVYGLDRLLEVSSRVINTYKQPALVQNFISGVEVTVGVVMKDSVAQSLAPLSIGIGDTEVYNYQKKEQSHLLEYKVIDGTVGTHLSRISEKLFALFGCKDAARFDFRICRNSGLVYFLECNPLPHLHPVFGDFCRSALASEISYAELIGLIIKSSISRYPELL